MLCVSIGGVGYLNKPLGYFPAWYSQTFCLQLLITCSTLACQGRYDTCSYAVLQCHQWKFTPKESKHYALKVVLQANLDSGTGAVKHSPGRHKAFLSIFGQGVCGEIKVRPCD